MRARLPEVGPRSFPGPVRLRDLPPRRVYAALVATLVLGLSAGHRGSSGASNTTEAERPDAARSGVDGWRDESALVEACLEPEEAPDALGSPIPGVVPISQRTPGQQRPAILAFTARPLLYAPKQSPPT